VKRSHLACVYVEIETDRWIVNLQIEDHFWLWYRKQISEYHGQQWRHNSSGSVSDDGDLAQDWYSYGDARKAWIQKMLQGQSQ
jgi:hypothetical protein